MGLDIDGTMPTIYLQPFRSVLGSVIRQSHSLVFSQHAMERAERTFPSKLETKEPARETLFHRFTLASKAWLLLFVNYVGSKRSACPVAPLFLFVFNWISMIGVSMISQARDGIRHSKWE